MDTNISPETPQDAGNNSPRKPSARQLAANRANAQKSTGPKSPEGKARSSRNGIRHGLTTTTFLVRNEDVPYFTDFRNAFLDRFNPRDKVELYQVEVMVHARWNQRRAWTIENEILNIEMKRRLEDLEEEFIVFTETTRLALAMEHCMSESRAVALIHRYEVRLENQFHRALKTLLEMKKDVPLPAGRSTLQNEPNPDSEHPEELPEPVLPGAPPPQNEPEPAPAAQPAASPASPAPASASPAPKTPSSTPLTPVPDAPETPRRQPEPEHQPSPLRRVG
jgi:hypothetical protein